MGAFDDNARAIGPPGAPLVRITGFAMWGGVNIKRAKKTSQPSVDSSPDRPQLES